MKIITWNVNGIRAVLSKNKKGLRNTGDDHVLNELILEHDPDILCLQETKCPEDLQVSLDFPYKKIIASKTRKGYSGVAIFSKVAPLNEIIDFPHNEEGRLLALEYENYWIINTYTPNSKPDLSRLSYRIDTWETSVRELIKNIKTKKPIVFVSDFNVAPTILDIHSVVGNERAHGFTVEERTAFAELLSECKLVDVYRTMNPTLRKYTWFSNFANSRQRNKGWRIDHILLSKKYQDKIVDVQILSDYYGSDHIPVYAEINI